MQNVFSFRAQRRGVRVFAASLIALIVFSACVAGPGALAPTAAPSGEAPAATTAADTGAAAGVVTIGFAAREFDRQSYAPLLAAFNQQNPAIRVQFVPLDEGASQSLDQLMRQTASAADTAAVFFLRPQDIKNGLVHNLKPLIDADAGFQADDFYPGTLETVGADGGVYLLPYTIRLSLLSYNKDLWSNRGLAAPRPDWTWNDLLAAAEQLAQKRGDTVDVYGLLDGSGGATTLLGLLTAAGVDLSPQTAQQLQLDRPEVAQALERVAALIESGALYTGSGAADRAAPDEFEKLVVDGRAAMWFGGPVIIGPNQPSPPFAVGSAALPVSAAGGPGGAEGYIMSAGTAHPQEAWRWLSFLSRQEVRHPFLEGNDVRLAPARKSHAERSGYWKGLDPATTAAVQATLARAGSSLTAEPADQRAVEALSQALAAVASRKRSVAEALAEAQAALDRQIAQAQATPSPTPDKAPIVVATPQVEGPAPGATAISFSVPLFQADQLRRLANEFNRQHPELFVDVQGTRLDRAQTPAAMAATADCFAWPDAIGSGQISATLDLAPLADADPDTTLDDYPPALLAPFQRGTALYGLPYQVSLRALTYNQSAFDAAGLAYPSASWTADDFLNAAQQLTSGADKDKRYGYAVLGPQTDELIFFLGLLGAQAAHDGAPNFTDPQVQRAIRSYLDLLRNYSPHERLQGYARDLMLDDEAFQLIEQGRVGMWFDLPGNIQIVRFGPGGGGASYTRAIAPPPGAGKATSDIQASGLYISAQSQHPQACWQWLKYLGADASALAGQFPARRSVAESDAFIKSAPRGAAEVYAAYRPALDRRRSGDGPAEPQRPDIDLFWFFRAVDRALQGKDLERELADAQALTEKYLTCVQSGTAAGTCATQVDSTYQGLDGQQ